LVFESHWISADYADVVVSQAESINADQKPTPGAARSKSADV
jgi:hypothetical protein